MIEIVMTRHPQPAEGAADPDRAPLTPLGRRQASAVGAHLAGLGFRADQLWTGPARRHRDGAALAMEVLAGYPPYEPLLALGDPPAPAEAPARARRALDLIRDEAEAAGAERVLVIASAEPIAAAALLALDAPAAALVALAAPQPHGALSRFALDRTALRLVSFNEFGFLQILENAAEKFLSYR